jgi:Protein of unknown function (DUF3016)
MKKNIVIFALALGSWVSLPVWAGDVSVKWQNPDNYTDINPAEQDKDKFDANLFKSFDNIFSNLAQKLPDNYHWQITVTDLDLAGDVRPAKAGAGKLMREMKPGYRPAMSFDYKLTDDKNNVVKEGKVDIKDPTFMSRSPKLLGVNVKPFPYEEFMINQWFAQQQDQKILPTK